MEKLRFGLVGYGKVAELGRAPALTGEDGRETFRIFEGIYRSDSEY
jgi:hypothetical protein